VPFLLRSSQSRPARFANVDAASWPERTGAEESAASGSADHFDACGHLPQYPQSAEQRSQAGARSRPGEIVELHLLRDVDLI
jgi:hypothetical protein